MMHQALLTRDILLKIFGRCRLPSLEATTSDLPALARTCHAFKEPALDVLWETLHDPSPLARCLPEASYLSLVNDLERYLFSRPLTETECDILRGYTRRIRSMRNEWNCPHEFDWESVRTFLNPPTAEPLFPNLRNLYCGSATEATYLLYLPFPSLTTLSVLLKEKETPYALQDSLELFSQISPDIWNLSIYPHVADITFGQFFSSCICRWQDLRHVDCPDIVFNMDALAHLSRSLALTHLAFMLSDTLTDSIASLDSPFLFPNLHSFRLHSEFLDPISRLLSQIQLPAITDFRAFIARCPTKSDISSFFASVQTSSPNQTIQRLELNQNACSIDTYVAEDPRLVLTSEDLRPCLAFSNLRRIDFNVHWDVDLPESELLAFASVRPHLEGLSINDEWGWNTRGGITPYGLLRLLQTCRSLRYMALAIDTRGYTKLHQSRASLGLTFSPESFIHVVDSRIKAKSVPAIAAFFAGFKPGRFGAWLGLFMDKSVHAARWADVYERTTAGDSDTDSED